MTESELKAISMLERIKSSTLSEDVTYVVSREKGEGSAAT
jgi:hypothetical protein